MSKHAFQYSPSREINKEQRLHLMTSGHHMKKEVNE